MVSDLDALRIPPSVKWGGSASMVAGAFNLAFALQTGMMLKLPGAFILVPIFMTALGIVAIAAGWRAFQRGSHYALVAATLNGAFVTVAVGGWAIFSFLRGIFSLFAIGVPTLAALSAVLAAVAIGPARKVTAAHEELADEGMGIRSLGPLALAKTHPRRLVAILAVVVVAAGGAVLWQRLRRPFDPLETPVGHLLGSTLTEAIVSHGEARVAKRAELRNDKAKKILGEPVVAALTELLDKSDALAGARVEERDEAERATEAFIRASGALDDALRQTGHPVFIDADVLVSGGRAQPLLMTYYIEREASFQVDDKYVAAIHLWRLDRLRVRLPFLGYTRPRTPRAMVVLDTVETDLVTGIGPALAPGEPFALFPERERARGIDWIEKLEKRAGERLRDEHRTEAESAHFARVAALLAKRRTLVGKWATMLPDLGLSLHVPERYLPEANYVDELAHRVPRHDLDEWEDIHDELRSRQSLDAFLELRRRFTGSVERHEVQHRLDYGAGLIPVPPILCDLLGVENPLGVPLVSLPARARDELSAHLAQIGAEGGTPTLDLLLLSRSVFRERFDAYSYAAWAALVGIGRELGLDVDADIGRGRVRSEQFARALGRILEKPPAEIAAAARRFRRVAYGTDLPDVRLSSTIERPAWRH